MDRGGENMKKPSPVATAIKVVVGLLFIIMAFDMDDSTIAVSLVIGLAFLAWAFLPYRRFQQEMQLAVHRNGHHNQHHGQYALQDDADIAEEHNLLVKALDEKTGVLLTLFSTVYGELWVFPRKRLPTSCLSRRTQWRAIGRKYSKNSVCAIWRSSL